MRIVHNTTFHVDKAIERGWLDLLHREHLPIMRRFCTHLLFTRVKIAGGQGEQDEPVYSLQLLFDDEEAHCHFIKQHLDNHLAALMRHFPGGFLYFCTTLEEVLHEA
jgi:hypothetical protein